MLPHAVRPRPSITGTSLPLHPMSWLGHPTGPSALLAPGHPALVPPALDPSTAQPTSLLCGDEAPAVEWQGSLPALVLSTVYPRRASWLSPAPKISSSLAGLPHGDLHPLQGLDWQDSVPLRLDGDEHGAEPVRTLGLGGTCGGTLGLDVRTWVALLGPGQRARRHHSTAVLGSLRLS